MYLVFIGIQGSGKGTQARLLEEKKGFKLYETGGALREISKKDTELGRLVKETIEAGNQVSPEIVEDILRDVIASNPGKDLILDGFVRNFGNKASVDKIVGEYQVVYFELPKEVAVGRLLGRMYNPKTGATFPAGTTTDPHTGDELVKRSDDEEAAIQKRIDLFYEKTMPVVEQYESEGNSIHINANQDIESVYVELISKLGV